MKMSKRARGGIYSLLSRCEEWRERLVMLICNHNYEKLLDFTYMLKQIRVATTRNYWISPAGKSLN